MKNKKVLFIPAIVVLIILIYKNTFFWLYERYNAPDTYYSHGFLIPFIIGYLIWTKRKELTDIKVSETFLGPVLIVIALIGHIFAAVMNVNFVSGFSLWCLLWGIVFYIKGKEFVKKIWFALFFVIFMLPLPLVAINAVSFPMKMFATHSAIFVMKNFMNLPIKNEGFQIIFPESVLVVGNPCSGLRSLISMLALGCVFAYLMDTKPWKRLLLVSLTIPIALITNIFRIIILSLGVYIYGQQLSKTFFHDFTGYLAFALALGVFYTVWRRIK